VAKQAVKDVCLAIDRFHAESKKYGYRYRKSEIKMGKVGENRYRFIKTNNTFKI